ncbi:MAG TPA: hypothetical protein VKA46_01470 [Gemmataceae bacterium]|nr:hypothetical protein [Gemmataceae bacterium]
MGLAQRRVCVFGTPFRLRDNLLVLPLARASIRAFFLDADLVTSQKLAESAQLPEDRLAMLNSMKLDLPPILDSERTPLVDALLTILDAQQQQIRIFEETIQQLRDEIAILKGQKPRPTIAPSRLEAPPP